MKLELLKSQTTLIKQNHAKQSKEHLRLLDVNTILRTIPGNQQ
jgi:hypothetical protein